jgi:subtilisin-like proprotein convertase family protein
MSAIRWGSNFVWTVSALALATGAVRAEEGKTVGRVKVTVAREGATATWDGVSAALEDRFQPGKSSRFANKRVVSLRPSETSPTQYEATVYDYEKQRAFELVVDADGRELSRRPSMDQPARSPAELADAYTIVSEHPAYAKGLAKGELQIYEAMPPVTVDGLGRRLINVGIMSPPTAGHPLTKNEIVSVSIPTGEVVKYAGGAPETSRANLFACGPGSSGCSASTATCAYYHVSWPAADPVWELNVRHPSCTSSVQGDGTGLELTDVYYRGRLILKRAEVPVLNVKYAGDSCGPFRDWLTSEDCFSAVGTDAAPGMRVTTAPPSTLCETAVDSGNFKGVALYDQGNALWLMTETNAGWYRYVMEWKLYLDGTIEPIFGFGATSNNCTCNDHYHHAYWRLEWAIDATVNGGVDDPATGITTLERHRAGTAEEYDPVTTEGSFIRPLVEPSLDTFRIRNPLTGNGYIIQPGGKDGTANNDPYGKWDLTALALNSSQINDPSGDTSINIGSWINAETLGTTKRLVTWYHATWEHDDPGGTGEACEVVGPKIVPLVPCAGSISIDRGAYACGSTISITMNDADLKSAGTATVSAFSGTESTPEAVTLTESPAGSGRFSGSIATTAAPAVAGDGMLSIVDGDTIHARYIDSSACGTPNVTVEKVAAADCSVPEISHVEWTINGVNATISWTTSEDATGILHYGTAIPTAAAATSPGVHQDHTVTLNNLASCTTYYFWLESADPAGNLAASNAGGGYYAFTTGQTSQRVYTATDTPVPIPDNNPTGASSYVSVAEIGPVQDVNVTTTIPHTYDGDLELSLIAPTGAVVQLCNRRGGTGENFTGTTFDDEAATAISSGTPPYSGSYRPETPLSALDGIPANGAWRFRVIDRAGIDTGSINAFILTLTLPSQACPAGTPPPPAGDGLAGLSVDRLPGLANAMHLNWDVAGCPATNYHLVFGSLAGLPTYTVDGGVCGLGPLGSYDWTGVPVGDAWFVVVADDAKSTEGSWGRDSTGLDRNGTAASAMCGFTVRSNAGACP